MTMIKIGEWNDLIVKREKEFGVYLGCLLYTSDAADE